MRASQTGCCPWWGEGSTWVASKTLTSSTSEPAFRSWRTPAESRWPRAGRTRPEPGPARCSTQTEQLVQASIETRLRGHLTDGEQHARNIRLAACRPMSDRQCLPGQSEDHLLVGYESRQGDAGPPHP